MLKRGFEQLLIGALCVAIGWFYVWTVRSSGDDWKFGQEQRDYYNLLIDGYLAGQLHMKVDVPEALLKLKDPYDPAQRPPGIALHDASFYHGKYYVYFGAAPIVVLMLPFRLLTGVDLPQMVAALVFVYGTFLASVAVWLAIRRRYFREAGTLVTLLVVAVLGIAGLEPVLLRRPHMWELPIGAGSCFAMLALGALWAALHAERRRAGWLAAAALALGLAIAARPTYLVSTPLLALPVLWWWRTERRWAWRSVGAVLIPLAIIGAAMAWHNYARFDDPLQFGQKYQLSLDYEAKMEHFSPRYAGFNLWRYFFSAAQWSPYFPFILPAELPPKPPGFAGNDDVYGLFRNLPIAWLAFVVPLAWWRRPAAERARLQVWLAAAGLLFAAMTAVLLCFFGSLARYQSDFAPALILLAAVGILAVERWARLVLPTQVQAVPRFAWIAAAAVSVVFGIIFSLQLDGLFLERNPETANDVARAFNQIPAFVERVLHVRHGAVEAAFRLRPHPEGERTLLTVGDAPRQDRVFVRYLDAHRVQLGMLQESAPPMLSRALEIDFNQTHTLLASLGSLFPPATHPLFAGKTPDEIAALTCRVQVSLDGERVIDEFRHFEPGTGIVRAGGEAGGDVNARFDGALLSVRRVAAEAPPSLAEHSGFVRLRLKFPEHPPTPREPLLTVGDPADSTLLFVHYVDDSGQIAFGTSRNGEHAAETATANLDLAHVHELTVRWSAGSDAVHRALEVRLDGVILADRDVAWSERDGSIVAAPSITAEPGVAAHFTGTVHQVQRSADGRDPLLIRSKQVRLRLNFPTRVGEREPLVVTGRNGGGDLFVIEYLAPDSVRFGLDHWSVGMQTCAPVRIEPGRAHDLEVTLPSLAKPADPADYVISGRVGVVLDGQRVWDAESEFFTTDVHEIAIGRNTIGGTSCGPLFTGDVLSVERLSHD